jgi:uncharacterized protein (TIGR02145 family)
MFQQVRGIVTKKSNEKQTPWESTSLTGDFYFNPDTSRNSVNQVQIIEPIAKLPAISGLEISNISATGALALVSLINDNGAEITVRGVCWNNTGNPTVSNNKTTEGIGIRGFSSNLLNLTPGKTYFVRAYATNSVGTEYSNQISFNTPSIRPDIVTEKVSANSSASAISTVTISSDGGAKIMARGVCWNTTPNPTIENEKTTDGSGIGKYSSTVNGLSPNTTYYLKAYSTNYLETSYGNEVVFKTLGSGQIKDIDDNVYNTIVVGNQTWLQENLKTKKYNDGTPIELVVDKTQWKRFAPSYCWYENQAEYGKTYGALYSLSAVMTDKLCPTGWHIPIKAEWETLINNMGGAASAWSILTEEKIAIVTSSNKKTTVFPGFKAFPGGYRDENGEYKGIGDFGSWWHYSRNVSMDITSHYLDFKNRQISYRKNSSKNKMLGLSVRCVKD